MSIQNEIERITTNISAAYNAVQEKGGTLPEEQNSDNLAAAIQEIPASGGVTSFNSRVGDVKPQSNDYTAAQVSVSSSKISATNVQSALEEVAASGGGGEVYSTTETVAGTWLGKTLYRRVYTCTSPSAANTQTAVLTLASNMNVVRISGYMTASGTYMQCGAYTSPTGFSAFFFNANDHKIYAIVGPDAIKMATTLCVEYTKT